jgi:hypothetical protein
MTNWVEIMKNDEEASNPTAKFLTSKIYAECCTGAWERSRTSSWATKQEALDYAVEFIGDYDLSTTEYYRPEFAKVEDGDPAMDAAIADLAKYHRITLGDFTVEIDELEN